MRLNIKIICCLLLFLISCGSDTKNTNPSGNNIPFFDERIFVDIKSIVSDSWSVAQDSSNIISLTKLDTIRICNFINSDLAHDEDYEVLIKNSFIGKVQFQLKYIFTIKLTDDEIKTIIAKNDSINKICNLLSQKYNIAHLSRKYDDFIPHNDADRKNINNFKNEKKELMKLYQKLPDYQTKKHDVYILDNLPWYGSICMRDIEGKVYDIRNRIKEYLQEN